MSILETQIEEAQRAICAQYETEFVATPRNSKTGFAASTKGLIPVNGIRHPVKDKTSGWYIWCGEIFSEAPEFFVPLHTYHLYEDYPEITRLLGLPSGYRFLLAGDYLDVWYDASLLNT
jgi:hypothetical protein